MLDQAGEEIRNQKRQVISYAKFSCDFPRVFYKKPVYKKLNPTRPKNLEAEKAIFQNLGTFLYREQKNAKHFSNLTLNPLWEGKFKKLEGLPQS